LGYLRSSEILHCWRTELIITFTVGAEDGISTAIRITKSVTEHGSLVLAPWKAHSLLETDLIIENVSCHRKYLRVTRMKYKLINSV